jgi:hypothetical protein
MIGQNKNAIEPDASTPEETLAVDEGQEQQ